MTEPVNYEIKVPYDDLMEAIENYLIYSGKMEDNQALLFVDLGVEVDDDGMASLDVETILLEDEPEPIEHMALVA